jgi:hypothetical protein
MEEALTAYLLADPGVAAVVDDRITWKQREQGSPLPALVLHLISSPQTYTMKAVNTLVRSRVQIDCLAESYLAALTLVRAVKAAGDAIPSEPGFQAAFVEGDRDTLTETENDPVLGRSLDLMVWHNPA